MAALKNDRDIALQAVWPRLIATSVAISADGASFTKTKNGGAVVPSTITLTAVPTIFTSPTYAWEYALSNTPTTWVSLGSGGSQVLTGSTVAGLIGTSTSIQYRVTASQGGFITCSNTFTVTYVKEADEPIIVNITRTNASAPYDSTGTTPTLVGGFLPDTGTIISVKRGTTDLTYNASSGNNTFWVSGTSTTGGTITYYSSPVGSGTTYTVDNITAMSSASITVVYTITCRDASGTVISPSFTVQITYTKILAGSVGADAYHIRLDNESRVANCEYTGVVKSGVFPMTGYAYITKGGVDITTGFSVAYTINSVSGATGSIGASSGVITVSTLTADVGYLEIKADITLPDTTHLYVYKKLFIYKLKDGAMAVNLDVTQDYANYAYVDATTTTSTSAHSVINFTATIAGISPTPTVTWSAKAYDVSGAELSPGGAALFTASGNTATMTPAQFGARGNPSTRYVIVTASYNTGYQTIVDKGYVYRLDGTGDYAMDVTANPFFSYMADATGVVTSLELAKESCTVRILRLTDNTYVTTGWQFSISATGGTAQINGGAGPYTAGSDPIITMSAITSGVTEGVITITATKSGFPTTIGKIEYQVQNPLSDGYSYFFDPRTEIILYVDSDNNVISYANAFTFFKILKGGVDDSINWHFTKVDSPNVTSTLTSL